MSGAPVQIDDAAYEPATGGAFGKKGIGWGIFEFARNPYYNVIVISIFAPFFASEVVGAAQIAKATAALAEGEVLSQEAIDNARSVGQSVVSFMIAAAGFVMAFCAPVLGSMLDRGGYMKPPLIGAVLMLALTTACLWFVRPGAAGAVWLGVILMATGYIVYSILEIFHNAMLPMAGAPKSLPVISGIGLAMGNIAGLSLVLAITIFLAGNDGPLVNIGTDEFQNMRIMGPIVAVWFLVFVIPFFLLMPDIKKTPERSWRKAAAAVFANETDDAGQNVGLIKKSYQYVLELFRLNPNVMRFLVGRMIYADGIGALLTLGSVYVGLFLGWTASQLGIYNVVGGLCAVVGALIAGFSDQRFGPKKSIIVELSVLIIVLFVQLSITKESLLFGLIPSSHIVWEGSLFPTLTDTVYFFMIIPAGLALGSCISSSRYMLLHIAPPKEIGRFFGFYAMAGSVTIWVAPLAVGVVTWLTGDLRIGMSGLGILFVAGLWIVSGVKAGKTPTYLEERQTGAGA
jgi:UMF1 family MFS transporter